MILDFDLVIPPGTTQAEPASVDCQLTHGLLTEARVYFPPGCATLVHVVVKDGLHQLVPANTDGTMNFDDALITSKLKHELTDAPHILTVYGWSPAAIYEHTITIQFELEPLDGQTYQDLMTKLIEEVNQPSE